MNRIVIVLLALTVTASAARAEESDDQMEAHAPGDEPNGYVASGVIVGEDLFERKGISGEVGMRIGRTPFFGRVMAGAGTLGLESEPGRGTYAEGRGGLEARRCGYGGMLCGSAGLDVGIHRGQFTHVDFTNGTPRESSERFDTVVAVPRLTVDGGGRIRVRGVLEFPQHMRQGDGSVSQSAGTARAASPTGPVLNQFERGFVFSLSLGVGF